MTHISPPPPYPTLGAAATNLNSDGESQKEPSAPPTPPVLISVVRRRDSVPIAQCRPSFFTRLFFHKGFFYTLEQTKVFGRFLPTHNTVRVGTPTESRRALGPALAQSEEFYIHSSIVLLRLIHKSQVTRFLPTACLTTD
jgi:hypothetical protein